MYYLATDTDLESVADAIREKAGRSDPLTFPDEFVSAVQSIPTGGGNVQPSKSVTPSETAQTVTPDSGYTSMAQVNVGAISSTYVGSDVDRRSSSDLTEAAGTVTVPAGYYEAEATKSVASGTVGQPAASKGLVSNHSVAVTPRVTVFAGYVPAAIKTGDAVTVTAAELVSGTKTITENGVHDVTNYEEVSVNVSGGGGGGGGATNMITGTFTTPSTSGAQTLTLPYTGSGYPVALMVFVAEGEYVSGSDWYNAIKRYAIGQFTIAKSNTQIAPSYGTSGAANQGVTSWIYKSSTSSATSYSRSSAMNTNSFSSSAASSSAAQICRFRSATQLSYYVIGSSGYGLMPDTEYRYVVLYSE